MEKTTYHCDICKTTVEGRNDLKTVGFFVWKRFDAGPKPEFPNYKKDLCVKCRVDLGLSEIVLKGPDPIEREVETPAEKLIELLREIFADEIAANMEDQQ